jgi:hypothetical protein
LWLAAAVCTAAAGVISFGGLHTRHHSDSLIPVLVSVQHWTPFYWGQDRFGMLLPLVARPVRDPVANMVVQGWLSTAAALFAPYLVLRFLLGGRGVWFAAASLANVAVLVSVPSGVQFDWFVTQPYALGICLAFGGLLIAQGNARRQVVGMAFMSLAHWVNLLTFLIVLPFIVWRRPDRAVMARITVVGLAAGVLVLLVFGGSEPPVRPFVDIRSWPAAWWALIDNMQAILRRDGWALIPLALGAVVTALMWTLLGPPLRRAIGTAVFSSVWYCLVVGTLEWVHANGFNARYLYPSLLMLALAVAVGIADLLVRKLPRRDVLLSAVLIVAAVSVYVPSSLNALRREMNAKFGGMTTDVVNAGVTVIAGDYWTVWPAVFHANAATFRLTGRCSVYGLTLRSAPTGHLWRDRRVLVGVPLDDPLGLYYAERTNVPLRVVQQRTTITVYAAF